MDRGDEGVISVTTLDGRIRAEFRWCRDRFEHRLLLDHTEVARSVDGDADEPWPDSPPLQQLSLEAINGQPTILGVGSAGRSHWSISVQPESPSRGKSGIRFDVAARARQPGGRLRSTYLVSESLCVEPIDAQISSEPSRQIDVSSTESSPQYWRRMVARPDVDSLEAGLTSPSTDRWSYRFVLCDKI